MINGLDFRRLRRSGLALGAFALSATFLLPAVAPDAPAFIRTLKAANAVQAVLYGPTGAQVSAFTFDVSRFRRIGEALSAANFRCAE